MARGRDPGEFDFGSGHPATYLGRRRRRRWPLVLVVVLLSACAALGVLWLYAPATVAPVLREMAPVLREVGITPPGAPVTRLYKWRGANGSWQVTDTPPPDGTPHEVLEYRGDVNIVPSVPPR
ncbi:MAG: hypothetical protein H6983_05285 [Ectothiorhodospiraceae bacterium]|nr:hypothetical protein [Chromatiales bacterium]MCP5153555.1 hypothetical protein [Ectothiorhodospiraceae bacterium]